MGSKRIFDQAITVFPRLQAQHQETREDNELQKIIPTIRETVDFFIEDIENKRYHEFDSTSRANSLKTQVDDFFKKFPDKANTLDPIFKEEGQKLLAVVSKELGKLNKEYF